MARCIARIVLLSVICFLATFTLGAEKPKPKEIAGRLLKVYEENGKRFFVVDLAKYNGEEAEREFRKIHPVDDGPDSNGPLDFWDPPDDTGSTILEVSKDAKFIGLRYPPNRGIIADSSITFDQLPYVAFVAMWNHRPKHSDWYPGDIWYLTVRDSVIVRAREKYYP